jgi:hypothetical protein
MNLKIKSAQSFGCTHRVRMYVYVFIGVSAHTYMSIYIYTVFLKKILLCLLFCPGDLQHEYSGNDCRQLKGPEARTEVSSLEYLKLCMFFSKKTFSAFLKFGGYTQQDILIHKARARVRKYLI